MSKPSKTFAKDQNCIECGAQAVAFYPIIDIDIKAHPYCQDCLDKQRLYLLKKLFIHEENK